MREEGIFPLELTSNLPKITMLGSQQVRIEQHKGLVIYQEDEVALQTSAGLLKLHGNNLSFAMYTSGEALITGQIDGISLCGGSGQ